MNVKVLSVALAGLAWLMIGAAPIYAAPESALRQTTTFALGGVGVAGSMSEGERALREVLKERDAVTRLESALPEASPAGQLYALLGLRLRDRAAYERALPKYQENDATVQTMRGCILQRESFRDLVKQIEQGDYDSSLAREWPENRR